MMNDKAKIRQRAASLYMRMLAMQSIEAAEDTPQLRPPRVLSGTRRFGRYDQNWKCDRRHNPDLSLDKRLEQTEFEVLHDTGPESQAFRPGARLTYVEVEYMLRHEYLSVNSLLVHVESGRQHQVLRGCNHHLVLEPPYAPGSKTS